MPGTHERGDEYDDPVTLEEFERLKRRAEHLELLKGELIRLPLAPRKHHEIRENLYTLLRDAVEIGKVHMQMGYVLGNEPCSWLQPDVSITHPDQPGDRYYEGAPLMVFEIVSEHDTARDLDAKVAEYLANEAAEVWVIYPDRRRAWVYGPSRQSARRETRSIRSELLPGIEIPLDDIL